MSTEPLNIEYKGYLITTDKQKMDIESIHKWLSEESYWVKGIPFETVKSGFDNSYCIGILKDGQQVGYGRLITDYTTIAYLADVYITAPHRGIGLSKKMMETLLGLDWVKKLRKVFLGTWDAHELYRQYGFKEIAEPARWMELTQQQNWMVQNNN